jgi:hypothetical protein
VAIGLGAAAAGGGLSALENLQAQAKDEDEASLQYPIW